MAAKKSAKSAKKSAKKSAAKKAPAKKTTPKKAAPRAKGGLNLRHVAPNMTVNDLKKSLEFYRDVVGFTVKEMWEDGGVPRGAMLEAGDSMFFMSQDDWAKGRDRVKGVGFRVYCTTDEPVDAIAKRMKAKGASLDSEPMSEEWGRHFAFTDPDGFKVTFMNEPKRR